MFQAGRHTTYFRLQIAFLHDALLCAHKYLIWGSHTPQWLVVHIAHPSAVTTKTKAETAAGSSTNAFTETKAASSTKTKAETKAASSRKAFAETKAASSTKAKAETAAGSCREVERARNPDEAMPEAERGTTTTVCADLEDAALAQRPLVEQAAFSQGCDHASQAAAPKRPRRNSAEAQAKKEEDARRKKLEQQQKREAKNAAAAAKAAAKAEAKKKRQKAPKAAAVAKSTKDASKATTLAATPTMSDVQLQGMAKEIAANPPLEGSRLPWPKAPCGRSLGRDEVGKLVTYVKRFRAEAEEHP